MSGATRSQSINSLAGLFNEMQATWNQVDLYIVVSMRGTKKDVILKNKPEKLLKTKGKATWIAKNKPENKAEKLLKARACGKN